MKQTTLNNLLAQVDPWDENDPDDGGWRECPRCSDSREDFACPFCHGTGERNIADD